MQPATAELNVFLFQRDPSSHIRLPYAVPPRRYVWHWTVNPIVVLLTLWILSSTLRNASSWYPPTCREMDIGETMLLNLARNHRILIKTLFS
jgi:fumarate reductase subunit C